MVKPFLRHTLFSEKPGGKSYEVRPDDSLISSFFLKKIANNMPAEGALYREFGVFKKTAETLSAKWR